MRIREIFTDTSDCELYEGDWVARYHLDGEVMEYGEVRKDSNGKFVVAQFSREGFYLQTLRADQYRHSRWHFLRIDKPGGMKV